MCESRQAARAWFALLGPHGRPVARVDPSSLTVDPDRETYASRSGDLCLALRRAQHFDAGKLLALEQLERRAAAGRNMLEFAGDLRPRLRYGGRAVAPADDGESRSRGHGPRDVHGAARER